MKRWFSIGVIGYMILGITWWGMLLYEKNNALYNQKLNLATPTEALQIKMERKRQNRMIMGEGIVLGLSLLAGIFIINRSANREIKSARQQSNFLLSVSHELKSPIAAIKLALETLTQHKLPTATSTKITSSAVQDVNRLEKLVQNILLSASLEESKLELYKEEIDISQLIISIAKRYNNSNNQVSIVSQGTNTRVTANIDRYNMQQAITNILDNAIKYGLKDMPINIQLSQTEKAIYISISNTGSSIKEDEKKLIFKKFYRGQDQEIRRQEGTGIGLYISNQIVMAHGGKIEIEDTVLNQVTFIIKLPK